MAAMRAMLALVPLLLPWAGPARAADSSRSFRAAELVAEELAPGSRIQVTRSRDASLACEILLPGVDDELPLILMVTGQAVGTAIEDWCPPSPHQTYRSPQLVVGLRVFDRAAQALRCGLALLEPTQDGSRLVFGGLRDLYLVDADTEPGLCGSLVALDDVFLGAGEEPGHDGVDEILVELPESDRRLDPETPAWSVPTRAYSWTKGGPLQTGIVDRRLVDGAVDAFVRLELSGADDEELVLAAWEREEAELPAALARLQEKHPLLRPSRLVREGSTVGFEARFAGRMALGSFLRDLEDDEETDAVTMSLSSDPEGVTVDVTYQDRAR